MANWAADFEHRNNIDPAKIVKRAKHGIHVKKGGAIEATFVGAPCHYQDSKGQWQPIDTALRLNTVRNRYFAPGVAVDIGSDGVASVYGKSWQHKTTRVGIWNPTKKTFAKAWGIPELGAVDGDSFVRSGKGWEYRQRVTESGLKETLTLFKKPNISLKTGTWLVLETYVPGLSAYPDGETKEWSESGMHFPLPSARDSGPSRMPLPCKRWKAGNYLYTGISAETFDLAVYPLVVDPDFTAESSQFEIYGANLTYSTARSTAIDSTVTPGCLYIGQGCWSSGENHVHRSGIKFATSSIGTSATIISVQVKMTLKEDRSTDADFDVQIAKYDWSASDPVTSSNRETVYDGILAAAQDAVFGNTASLTSVKTEYTSNNLSTAWVNKAGNTYYCMLSSRDKSGTAPSGIGYVWEAQFYYDALAATASYRPKLTVTYFIPQAFFRAPMWGRF